MAHQDVVFNKGINTTSTKFNAHAHTFEQTFDCLLQQSTDIDIVSGYVDAWAGQSFGPLLINKANAGHRVRILIGRAEKEGLHQSTQRAWSQVDTDLRAINAHNGIFAPKISVHAKVYVFYMQTGPSIIYVGSSNFSRTGFYQWLECSTRPTQNQITNIESFISNLFSPSLMINFNQIQIKGSSSYQSRMNKKPNGLQSLKRHQLPPPSVFNNYPLTSVVDLNPYGDPDKAISSLNLFHGPGRVDQNGRYKPRPWYEIELTLGSTNYPFIPRDFTAYTDDGYIMPMQRRSGGKRGQPNSGSKDLTSKGNRRIFGEWLKGKLENAGALQVKGIIDRTTFATYGSHELKFYDMGNNNFYLVF